MNTRQAKLLHVFLHNCEKNLSAQELAEKLSCSERTIRNDIPVLRKFLLDHCPTVDLTSRRGLGYRLVVPGENEISWVQHELEIEKPTTSPEIGLFINGIHEILLTNHIHSLDSLAKHLGTNRDILNREMKRWDSMLSTRNLVLSRQPYIHVIGDEVNIRAFFVYYYYKMAPQATVNEIAQLQDNHETIVFSHLIDYLADLFEVRLTHNTVMQLSLYLYVSWRRILCGREIPTDHEPVLSEDMQRSYQALTPYIHDHLDIDLSKAEFLSLISIMQIGAKRISISSEDFRSELSEVTEAIDVLLERLRPIIPVDNKLVSALNLELETAVKRRELSIPVNNFDVANARYYHLESFLRMNRIMIDHVEPNLGSLLPEDYSRIAMLLASYDLRAKQKRIKAALVINSSAAVELYVTNCIEDELGSLISIEQIVGSHEIEQLSDDIELVISTVPIAYSRPHTVISSAVTPRDINQIKQFRHRCLEGSTRPHYLRNKTSHIDLPAQPWKTTLYTICRTVIKQGCWEGDEKRLELLINGLLTPAHKTVYSAVFVQNVSETRLFDFHFDKEIFIDGFSVKQFVLLMVKHDGLDLPDAVRYCRDFYLEKEREATTIQ